MLSSAGDKSSVQVQLSVENCREGLTPADVKSPNPAKPLEPPQTDDFLEDARSVRRRKLCSRKQAEEADVATLVTTTSPAVQKKGLSGAESLELSANTTISLSPEVQGILSNQRNQVIDILTSPNTSVRLNHKNKPMAQCEKCSNWYEQVHGLRIHQLSCTQ